MTHNELSAFSVIELSQLAVELAVECLVSKDIMDTIFEFKKARLVKSSGKDGWYIMYYVWDIQKNGLSRKRKFIPPNYHSDDSREAYAKDIIKKINALLKSGYHIDRKKAQEQQEVVDPTKPVYSVKRAAQEFITIKKAKRLYDKGLKFYDNTLNQFVKWLALRKLENIWIGDLNYRIVDPYFTYLLVERNNEAKTYNNALGVLKTFYNECLKQEWVEGKSPFDKVDKLPVEYGTKNKPFTTTQISEIKEYILEHDEYLWSIICFIYYLFLRPSEIRRLKVGDIDLEKNQIWISGKISKTKKREVLPIVPALRKEIDKMKLHQFNTDDYLFSSELHPSKEGMGDSYITKHFRKVKNHFNLGSDYTVYGFKHTAVVNWYKAEKDIRKIQKMCRHSSMLMTERYLKSLGLLDDRDAVKELPEI